MNTGEALNWEGTSETAGGVRFIDGAGGLPMLSVTTEWSSAEIYLHGAHVAGFQKRNEPPLLFLSEVSQFAEGKAIRGGIPIILPWFGAREGLPAHGFARTRTWELKAIDSLPDGSVRLH